MDQEGCQGEKPKKEINYVVYNRQIQICIAVQLCMFIQYMLRVHVCHHLSKEKEKSLKLSLLLNYCSLATITKLMILFPTHYILQDIAFVVDERPIYM
jgi:hypothetical protein